MRKTMTESRNMKKTVIPARTLFISLTTSMNCFILVYGLFFIICFWLFELLSLISVSLAQLFGLFCSILFGLIIRLFISLPAMGMCTHYLRRCMTPFHQRRHYSYFSTDSHQTSIPLLLRHPWRSESRHPQGLQRSAQARSLSRPGQILSRQGLPALPQGLSSP